MGILKGFFDKLSRKKNDTVVAADSSDRKETFDHNKVTVIFVLGGPGAGDSTL